MKPVIFMRVTREVEEEAEVVRSLPYLGFYTQRVKIPGYSLVIGRYSVLPFYKELQDDLAVFNSRLVNSYDQHKFCADIFEWYDFFSDYTPATWKTVSDVPSYISGPFVIKGVTNSRKHNWNTMMFAKDREQIGNVVSHLLDDTFISEQGLCIRQYIPLKTYFKGLNDMPVTQEYRFFCYRDKIVSSGFYWSSHVDDLKSDDLRVPSGAQAFVTNLINLPNKPLNFPEFYVLDVALTEKGKWVLIEVNDGQMSGLSENDPKILYENLQREVNC